MWTRGPAMLPVPASGPAKPVTISFDEAGTPTAFPTAIGSFYAAEKLVSFGSGVYFADYAHTNGVIGTSMPRSPGARSGTKFAHFFQDNGSVIINFAAALAARKIVIHWQKGGGFSGDVLLSGSGGQSMAYGVFSGEVTTWTSLTFDLDGSQSDPPYWGASFITQFRINVASFGAMAIEDITIF